jgi:CHAT domain-containing protein
MPTLMAAAFVALVVPSGGVARQAKGVGSVAPPSQAEAQRRAVELNTQGFERYQAGDFDAAVALFDEALRFSRQNLGETARVTLTSLSNYAAVLESLGRLAEAEPLQADVVRLRRINLGDKDPETITAINNHAATLFALDRVSEAEPLFADALQARREVLGEEHPDTLASLSNYAMVLKRLDRLEEAEPLYTRALATSTRLRSLEHPETLTLLNNHAAALRDLGRASEAEPLAAQLVAARRALLGDGHPDTLTAMNNHAVILLDLGRTQEAEPLLSQTLALRRATLGDRHPLSIATLISHAAALEALGRRKEAAERYAQGQSLAEAVLGPLNTDTLMVTGRLAALALEDGHAERSFELALKAANGWKERTGYSGQTAQGDAQRDRDARSEAAYKAFVADAGWAAREARPERSGEIQGHAFRVLQELLSGSASKALRQSAARQAVGEQVGLAGQARRLQQLNTEWQQTDAAVVVSLALLPGEEPDDEAAARARLQSIEAEITALTQVLQRDAPAYFNLIQPKPLSETDAQWLLEADEAAILMVPSDRGTHVFLVSSAGIAWHRSDWTEERIDAAVTRLLWDVGASPNVRADQVAQWENEGEGAYPYDFQTAHALYRELFAPVAGRLADKRHVFVMAAGSLASLPMGILVSEVPDGANGDPAVLRSAKWLADQYAFVTVPNLQAIALLRQTASQLGRPRHSRFLGVGDPMLQGIADSRGARNRGAINRSAPMTFTGVFSSKAKGSNEPGIDLAALRQMARLPGTATELNAMWKAFGQPSNALHLAEAATEPGVRAMPLQADVIAFATHGLLAGEIGGTSEPGLVMTPPSQASADNDGFLSMSDIAGLAIDADWVVLSACNTAAGDGTSGASGLSGLARAFFYAGARNLLVSHWPVRDDVAAKITVRAISLELSDPTLSRAQALQIAMREIRNDPQADTDSDTWAHPSAWAPFVLVGDR